MDPRTRGRPPPLFVPAVFGRIAQLCWPKVYVFFYLYSFFVIYLFVGWLVGWLLVALQEEKIMLAKILQKVRVESVKDYVPSQFQIVLNPVGGVPMRIFHRS